MGEQTVIRIEARLATVEAEIAGLNDKLARMESALDGTVPMLLDHVTHVRDDVSAVRAVLARSSPA